MLNVTLTAEEFNTLIAQREAAVTEREALRGELKVVKIERDLLQEKLNAFLRKLFAAKSEARGNGQSELFNEAEALASAGPMSEEIPVESGIEIAGHTRQKRNDQDHGQGTSIQDRGPPEEVRQWVGSAMPEPPPVRYLLSIGGEPFVQRPCGTAPSVLLKPLSSG